LIARPQGRLDAAAGASFAAAVERQLQAGTTSLLLDLEKLDFIAFGGIRAILRLGRTAKARNVEVVFANATGEVFEALDASGLDEIFTFLPTPPSNMGKQDAQYAP
jgi:anti-anti-sigma factor